MLVRPFVATGAANGAAPCYADPERSRAELAAYCRRTYGRGYVAATDGNLSVRTGRGILVTPSGWCLDDVTAESLVEVDMQGRVVAEGTPFLPTSELPMHLAVYGARPDVHAVIHAHPKFCIAFSLVGRPIAHCILPEVVLDLGSIPTARYATPSTPDGAEAVRPLLLQANAIALDHHGSLTYGATLQQAFFRLERMEHAAEITHAAMQLGDVIELPSQEVRRLLDMKKARGELDWAPRCSGCGACLVADVRRMAGHIR